MSGASLMDSTRCFAVLARIGEGVLADLVFSESREGAKPQGLTNGRTCRSDSGLAPSGGSACRTSIVGACFGFLIVRPVFSLAFYLSFPKFTAPARKAGHSMANANQYKSSITEERAELAFNCIAEQLGNIEAAIFMLDDCLTRVQAGTLWPLMYQNVYRVTVSWLILTMAKVEELWRKYAVLAEPTTREKMKAVLKEISDRGLTDMRDKSIAHIIDHDTDDPLTPQAIEDLMKRITRGDFLAFIFG